jgi:hypothetical protein
MAAAAATPHTAVVHALPMMCIGVHAAVVVECRQELAQQQRRHPASCIGSCSSRRAAAAAGCMAVPMFVAAVSVLQVVLRADLLHMWLYAAVYCLCSLHQM